MELNKLAEAVLRSALSGEIKGIIAAVLPLAGLAALGSLIFQIRIGFWPSVPGRLIIAEIVEAGADSVKAQREYVNEVEYRYTVNGKGYVGTKLSPWEIVASSNFNKVLELQLPISAADDKSVAVIYNPRTPEESYLKRPGLGGKLFTAIFAAAMLSVPFLLF